MPEASNTSAVVVVQARLSSVRLPGKTLSSVGDGTVLSLLLERLESRTGPEPIIVATSVDESDDPIAEFCAERDAQIFRGSLEDVAGRFVALIGRYAPDAIVRINADSPLLDPRLIDRAIEIYFESRPDLVTNVMPRSFPVGQSVEVISARALLDAYPRMTEAAQREHVTRYFYQRPESYSIVNFSAPGDHSSVRMAVDTAEDLERVRAVIANLDRPHTSYGYAQLLARFDAYEQERARA